MSRKKWIWSDKEHKLVPAQEYDRWEGRVHYVIPDIPPYQSPASFKWIDGRRQRREDLKATGSREIDPSERPKFTKPPEHKELDIDWKQVEHDVFGRR